MTTTAQKILGLARLEPVTTRDEAVALATQINALSLKMEEAANKRDERLEAVALEFNLLIDSCAGEIERLQKRLAAWAKLNRSAEFGDKQGIPLAGGKAAFRQGTGKVEFNPGVKSEDVLDALLGHEDPAVTERFVTIATSINKAAVIAAWKNNTALQSVLAAMGITVVKEEKFSYTPDRDAVPEAAPVVVKKEVA